MRNVAIVIKHEILSTLGKPSFWVTTFVLPAVIMVFSFGAQFFSAQVFDGESQIVTEQDNPETLAIGYVDLAGLINDLPTGVPDALVRAFPDEASAHAAMEADELSQYYVLAADYLESGTLDVVDSQFSPLGNSATTELFHYIINYNLLGDETLTHIVANPTYRLVSTALGVSPDETPGNADSMTQYVVAFGTLFIFFFVLTMSSSFMLRSVSREKENRTVEMLLVSLRPRDLMLGKVLGLGVVALLQMLIWSGGSLLTLTRGDSMLASLGLSLSTAIVFPDGFILWAVGYFLLGYILYASMLGAVGALAPNARETGPFTFLVMLPLMLPMMFNNIFVGSPHGLLATALSLFPLTAPTSMLPRLAIGGVPGWQPLVALLGLAVTTYIFVGISARFFRADTLLSNLSLNWKRLLKEYRLGKG